MQRGWIGLGAALWLLAAAPAPAATIDVDTTTDELTTNGNCSLREAVRAANLDMAVDGCTAGSGADTIVVPAGTYTLALAGAAEENALTGDLDLTAPVSITGAGPVATVIDADGLDRVFDVFGGTVSFADLTIRDGAAPSGEAGGGVRASGATLTFTDCAIRDNGAQEAGGLRIDLGTLTLLRSTIRDNTATGSAGGLYPFATTTFITDSTVVGNGAGNIGGGMFTGGSGSTFVITITGSTFSGNSGSNGAGMFIGNDAQVVIRNSTLSGNTSSGAGGAIFQSFGAGVTLSNVTITDNTANQGGGVGENGASSAPITLRNTILAGNTATGDASEDCYGPITSEGYNLIQVTTGCTVTTTTGDVIGMAPALLALADNGGLTETHALDVGSPAHDAGNPATPGSGGTACETTDQRGHARPSGAACDIGAIEQGAAPPTTTTTTLPPTTTTTTTTPTTTTTLVVSTTTTSTVPTTSTTAPVSPSTSTTTPAPPTTTTTMPPLPLCATPVPLTGLRLKITKAGAPLGDEQVLLRGTLDFSAGSAAAFAPASTGMQLLIEELPGGPLWDLTRDTAPIPAGDRGSGCGPRDGWTKTKYKNASGALPPSCAAGTAAGLQLVQLRDRRSKGKGILLTAKARRAAMPTPSGGLRVTVVLDAAGGACAVAELAAGACETKGKKVTCD